MVSSCCIALAVPNGITQWARTVLPSQRRILRVIYLFASFSVSFLLALCTFLYLSVSPVLFVILCHSVPLSLYLSLYILLSLPPFLPLSLSLSLSLSIYLLSLSISLSLSLSLLSLYRSLSLSLSLSISLSLFLAPSLFGSTPRSPFAFLLSLLPGGCSRGVCGSLSGSVWEYVGEWGGGRGWATMNAVRKITPILSSKQGYCSPDCEFCPDKVKVI
jgi:hypothetical protein